MFLYIAIVYDMKCKVIGITVYKLQTIHENSFFKSHLKYILQTMQDESNEIWSNLCNLNKKSHLCNEIKECTFLKKAFSLCYWSVNITQPHKRMIGISVQKANLCFWWLRKRFCVFVLSSLIPFQNILQKNGLVAHR